MVSPIFEYKSKDTARLSGVKINEVCNHECPRDKTQHLCTQTENGLSVRSYMTVLTFAKAMAWFRGNAQVEIEDVRQVIPFILHEKLYPNLRSPFYQVAETRVYRMDRVAWIRNLWDLSAVRFEASGRAIDSDVDDVQALFDQGLEGLAAKEVRRRMQDVRKRMEAIAKRHELDSFCYEATLALKYYYMRYQSYLIWLEGAS
jgi:hypothetical protein